MYTIPQQIRHPLSTEASLAIGERSFLALGNALLKHKASLGDDFGSVLSHIWYQCLRNNFVEGLVALQLNGFDPFSLGIFQGYELIEDGSDEVCKQLAQNLRTNGITVERLFDRFRRMISSDRVSLDTCRDEMEMLQRVYFNNLISFCLFESETISSVKDLVRAFLLMHRQGKIPVLNPGAKGRLSYFVLSNAYLDIKEFVALINEEWLPTIFKTHPQIANKFIVHLQASFTQTPAFKMELAKSISESNQNFDANLDVIATFVLKTVIAETQALLRIRSRVTGEALQKQAPHLPAFIALMTHSPVYFYTYLPRILNSIVFTRGVQSSEVFFSPSVKLDVLKALVVLSGIKGAENCFVRSVDTTRSNLIRHLRGQADRLCSKVEKPTPLHSIYHLRLGKYGLRPRKIIAQELNETVDKLKQYREENWGTFLASSGERRSDEHSSEKASARAYEHVKNVIYPEYWPRIMALVSFEQAEQDDEHREYRVVDYLMRQLIKKLVEHIFTLDVVSDEDQMSIKAQFEEIYCPILDSYIVNPEQNETLCELNLIVAQHFVDISNIYVLALRTLLNTDNVHNSFFLPTQPLSELEGADFEELFSEVEHSNLIEPEEGSTHSGEGGASEEEDDEEVLFYDEVGALLGEEVLDREIVGIDDILDRDEPFDGVYAGAIAETGEIRQDEAEHIVRKMTATLYSMVCLLPDLTDTQRQEMFFYLSSSIAEVGSAYEANLASNACLPGHISILVLGVLNHHPNKELHLPAFRDEQVIEAASKVLAQMLSEQMGVDKEWSELLLNALAGFNENSGIEEFLSGEPFTSLSTGQDITFNSELMTLREIFTKIILKDRGFISKVNDLSHLAHDPKGEGELTIEKDSAALNYVVLNPGNDITRRYLVDAYMRRFSQPDESDPVYITRQPFFLFSELGLTEQYRKRYSVLPSSQREDRVHSAVERQKKIYDLQAQILIYACHQLMIQGISIVQRYQILKNVIKTIYKLEITHEDSFFQLMGVGNGVECLSFNAAEQQTTRSRRKGPSLREIDLDECAPEETRRTFWDMHEPIEPSSLRLDELSLLKSDSFSPRQMQLVRKGVTTIRHIWGIYDMQVNENPSLKHSQDYDFVRFEEHILQVVEALVLTGTSERIRPGFVLPLSTVFPGICYKYSVYSGEECTGSMDIFLLEQLKFYGLSVEKGKQIHETVTHFVKLTKDFLTFAFPTRVTKDHQRELFRLNADMLELFLSNFLETINAEWTRHKFLLQNFDFLFSTCVLPVINEYLKQNPDLEIEVPEIIKQRFKAVFSYLGTDFSEILPLREVPFTALTPSAAADMFERGYEIFITSVERCFVDQTVRANLCSLYSNACLALPPAFLPELDPLGFSDWIFDYIEKKFSDYSLMERWGMSPEDVFTKMKIVFKEHISNSFGSIQLVRGALDRVVHGQPKTGSVSDPLCGLVRKGLFPYATAGRSRFSRVSSSADLSSEGAEDMEPALLRARRDNSRL